MTVQMCCGNIRSDDLVHGPSRDHSRAPPTSKNCYKDFKFTECGKCCDDYKAGVEKGGPGGGPSSCTPTDWGGYCNKPGSKDDYYYMGGDSVPLEDKQWENIQSRDYQGRLERAVLRNEENTSRRLREDMRHERNILRRRHGGVYRYPRSSSTLHGSDKSELNQDIETEIATLETALGVALMFIYFLMAIVSVILAYFIGKQAIKFFKKYVSKKST